MFRVFYFEISDICIMLTQELMEKLKMPSDAQLMQIAIDDLNNFSLSLEDRQRALQELLILVEPIDNANGRCGYFISHRAAMFARKHAPQDCLVLNR
jgi:hypothetical protein